MVLLHSLRTAFYVLHGTFVAPPISSALAPSTMSLYAGLRACDVMGHVNNARFLEYFEFARWHHSARMGIRKYAKTGIYPVVGTVHLQYMKELKPFQFCEVQTRIVDVQQRSVNLEQRLVTGRGTSREKLHACLYMKATFLKKGKPVEVAELIEAYGIDRREFLRSFPVVNAPGLEADKDSLPPPTPPFVEALNNGDELWRQSLRAEREAVRAKFKRP